MIPRISINKNFSMDSFLRFEKLNIEEFIIIDSEEIRKLYIPDWNNEENEMDCSDIPLELCVVNPI